MRQSVSCIITHTNKGKVHFSENLFPNAVFAILHLGTHTTFIFIHFRNKSNEMHILCHTTIFHVMIHFR
jgi:hypothetical protein